MVENPKNIKLLLSYDGKGYHGWQRQKNAVTVQEVLEEQIQMMVGETVTLIASGRTDAGVHAISQVCHFITKSGIEPHDMKRGLNSLLPDDILIRDASYVSLEFHARYSVKSKSYEYHILNREEPDVFRRHYLWHVRRPLDTAEMRKCLTVLTGRHDFSAFRSTGSRNMNPVRTIMQAELDGPCDGMLCFAFEADGFLRHMVRNLVGTIVEAGLGKITSAMFFAILESRDRREAGIKAPPQGLFLKEVKY